eukprot:gb/GEZN01010596.1/.p1 GENE.gb/GEZN01010596.1/~~gb/GEZN01010596.1/.p1  ORF type:complete len:295 (+),score=27.94 gb/GEZN01010596.1/:77-961(+)
MMGSGLEWLPVLLACLLHHDPPAPLYYWFSWRENKLYVWGLSLFLVLCPPHSPAALLGPLANVCSQFSFLLSTSRRAQWSWLLSMSRRATLPGLVGAKLVEVFFGWLLLSVWEQQLWPTGLWLGAWPSPTAFLVVIILAAGTNLVLNLWSMYFSGDESGVRNMVEDSRWKSLRGKSLTLQEHSYLAVLGLANALAEEGVSRGFFFWELKQRGRLSDVTANLAQAAAFGIWHYHGIPSGLVGVVLTFVYGLLMGCLQFYGGGLLLPLLAHTIADYFIFAVIARQQTVSSGPRSKS